MTVRHLVSLEASVEASGVTTKTYQGREYLAVPVVALVEGVLQGVNSEVPELASASVFSRHVEGWNGRPVVMDHPQTKNGEYVSANDPAILEDWAFGQVFGAKVEDKKLKLEAWLDIAAAAEKGGSFQNTVERVLAGTIVEVSVGVYVDLVQMEGVFDGEKYGAVWTLTTPDHLALLSEGTIGACSVERGCGTPRVNARFMSKSKPTTTEVTPASLVTSQSHCTCEGGASTCGCDKGTHTPSRVAQIAVPPSPFEVAQREAIEPVYERFASAFRAEALPNNRFEHDIYKAIRMAVYAKYPGAHCVGYTTEFVVYEAYNGTSYGYFKVGINVDESLNVTFTSEPVEVMIATEIIDRTPTSGDTTMTVASAPTPDTTAAQPAPAVDTPPAPAAPTVHSTPTPAPVTLKGYIDAAPAEIREVLEQGVRTLANKKAAMIKALSSIDGSPFTEAELTAMSSDQLDKLMTLAGKAAATTADAQRTINDQLTDFAGLGIPRVQSRNNEQFAPEPEPLFPIKKTA